MSAVTVRPESFEERITRLVIDAAQTARIGDIWTDERRRIVRNVVRDIVDHWDLYCAAYRDGGS